MIYLLIEYLKVNLGYKIPAVFTYFSTRMILAALTSFLFSIFLGPYFIKKLYELKIGQSIRIEDCPLLGKLHEKKQNTPTMGGILIIASLLVSMVLWMDPRHVFTLILLLTTLFLAVIGGIDDYLKLKFKNTKGLSAKGKLLFQLIFSGLIAGYLLIPSFTELVHVDNWYAPPVIKEHKISKNVTEVNDSEIPFLVKVHHDESQIISVPLHEFSSRVYIPFVKDPVVVLSGAMAVLAFCFIVFIITGSSNAVNLTDGLDGLAGGCLIMVASCLALIGFISNNIDLAGYLNIAYIEGSGEIAIYLSAFIGACLGFLWYNAHPAQVFMGDIGSLTLGGIIGVSAVLLKRELLLGIIGGIFVAETLSVILQVGSYKLRNKKRIFLCAPLHHHFEYKGWHETKVVTRFWIVGLLLAIVGIASLKFQ